MAPTSTSATPPAKPLAWVNGRVLPADQATVPLLDDGFLRGDAVFEGVLVRGGRTHALDLHLARLLGSAREMGIRVPAVKPAVRDILAAWGERDGALKIVVTRGGNLIALLTQTRWPPSMSLIAIEMPWTTALSGVKTLSYAVNQWASRQAHAEDADDALIVTGGNVAELPNASLLFHRDGRWHSPDPATNPILASVTLRTLRDIENVTLGTFTLDEVLAADEVAVVSATRTVLGVHAIDDAVYPAPGPVTAALHAAFDAHISATMDPRD